MEQADKEAQKAALGIDSEIYDGNVELVVPFPIGPGQLRQFKEYLDHVSDLNVAGTSGSLVEGLIITVSVHKPMTLIRILSEMPMVENVNKKGKKIVVMLKTPSVS